MSERGKLRKKIDTFEPEISGSLWDRIEHDLNRKDKKSAWFIYSMLLGLLGISLFGGYYYWQYRQVSEKLIGLNQNHQNQTKLESSQKTESVVDTMNKTVIMDSKVNSIQQDAILKKKLRNQSSFATANAVSIKNPASQSHDVTLWSDITRLEIMKAFEVKAKPFKNLAVSYEDTLEFKKLPLRPPNIMVTFIGSNPFELSFSSGLGMNQSRVMGFYRDYFLYENPSDAMHLSLQLRYFRKQYFGFSAGISKFTSGSVLKYKMEEAISLDTNILQGSKKIVAGDSVTLRNTQAWTEIPVNLICRYPLNKFLFIEGSVGLGIAFINSYAGYEPNPAFSAFEKAGTFGSSPFKTHINTSASLSIGYRVSSAWMLSLGCLYRQSLGSISNNFEPVHPNRFNRFVGANLGIVYRLGY